MIKVGAEMWDFDSHGLEAAAAAAGTLAEVLLPVAAIEREGPSS